MYRVKECILYLVVRGALFHQNLVLFLVIYRYWEMWLM